MKRVVKYTVLILLVAALSLSLVACAPTASPAVAIGYKVGGLESGSYSEAIEKFVIGEDMYCCVTVKIVTDKKAMHTYTVEISVPKTEDVEIIKRGGLDAKEVIDDAANGCVIMRFDVQGSKEATEQKMMFKGKPFDEGDATVQVTIYDEGEKIYGYSSTVEFVYE